MTFFPDGETNIPNQTPVPSATGRPATPGTPATPGAPATPTADPQFTKALVRTAMINGAVLVVAVLLAYIFPITDDAGAATLIVVAAAMFSAVHLTVVLQAQQRRRRAQARMAGPAAPGTVYGQVQPAAGAQPYGATEPAAVPPGSFAMTVEDVFTITGRGTVVTGRVTSGALRPGQVVSLVRGGVALRDVEVTGIEMVNRMAKVATQNENVGLLLGGVTRSDVQRGDVLTA